MKRRALPAALGAMLPLAALAQRTGRLPRIDFLAAGSQSNPVVPSFRALLEGLRELGYVEGRSMTLVEHYADWNPALLRQLAGEVAALHPDVIIAPTTPAASAAKAATSAIPIVAPAMGDPLADGLIRSLASPGGNLTGNTYIGPELVAKRVALLHEAVPGATRIAGLWHEGFFGPRTQEGFLREAEKAARKLGLVLHLVRVRGPQDLEHAFTEMDTAKAEALIVMPSGMLYAERRRIVALADRARLPAIYQARECVDDGGLIAYGANVPALFRQAAAYVDRILKGARPADLPVVQPTQFELLVNLRTARSLGLTIPPSILAQADEVLE